MRPEQGADNIVSFLPFNISLSQLSAGDVGLLFAVLCVLAGAFRTWLLRLQVSLSHDLNTALSKKAFSVAINRDYEKQIKQNSSEVIATVVQKIGSATLSLSCTINVITSLVVIVGVLSIMILHEPVVTAAAAGMFSLVYLTTASVVESRLVRNSHIVAKNQSSVMQGLREAFGGLREIIMGSHESKYVKNFEKAFQAQQQANKSSAFLNQAPKYFIETLAMLSIAAVIWFASSGKSGFQGTVPVLVLLGISAQRLLPLFQQVYSNAAGIASGLGLIDDALDLLDQQRVKQPEVLKLFSEGERFESLDFVSVSFAYGQSVETVLSDVNLKISVGDKVGIKGVSGNGKSTFLDIAMALLQPTGGVVKVNSIEILNNNKKSWQSQIAHVPQSVFLFDETVLENIVCGAEDGLVDMDRVIRVAQIAKIHTDIFNLPNGYEERVGEKGVRLSGGQRQRLGIARALYQNKPILILDEATNALDVSTEALLLRGLADAFENLTVILVTHRKEALQICNKVFEVKNKRLISCVESG